MSSAATGGAAAASAAIAQATRASGAIVRMNVDEFVKLLHRDDAKILVISRGKVTKKSSYLLNYKGFFFLTISKEDLPVPEGVEVITADRIWVP